MVTQIKFLRKPTSGRGENGAKSGPGTRSSAGRSTQKRSQRATVFRTPTHTLPTIQLGYTVLGFPRLLCQPPTRTTTTATATAATAIHRHWHCHCRCCCHCASATATASAAAAFAMGTLIVKGMLVTTMPCAASGVTNPIVLFLLFLSVQYSSY